MKHPSSESLVGSSHPFSPAGIDKLTTADGKAFTDPEILGKLTSSVSSALDEAEAALYRMRSESAGNQASQGADG